MQPIITQNYANGQGKAWQNYASPLQRSFRESDEKRNEHLFSNIYSQTKNRTNFDGMSSSQHKTNPINDFRNPQTHSISQTKSNFPSASNNVSYPINTFESPSFSKYEVPFKSEERMSITTNENSPKSQETVSWSQSQFPYEKNKNTNSNKIIQNRVTSKEQHTRLNEMSVFEKHDEQIRKYQAMLLEKNRRINQLVEKLADESKKGIQEEANSFMQSVLKTNAELQNQLSIQVNTNKQNKRAIEELQTQNLQLRDKCEKLQSSKKILERDFENAFKNVALKDEEKIDANSPNYFLVEGFKRKIKELQLSLIALTEDHEKLKRKNTSSQDYFYNELREGLEKLKKQKTESHQSFLKLSHSISSKEIQINLLKMKLQGYDRKIQNIGSEMALKTKLIQKIGANMKALLDDEGKKQIMLAMQEVLDRFKVVDQQRRDYEKQIEELNKKIELLTL